MTPTFDEAFGPLKSERLSDAEREQAKKHLMSFMKKEVRMEASQRHKSHKMQAAAATIGTDEHLTAGELDAGRMMLRSFMATNQPRASFADRFSSLFRFSLSPMLAAAFFVVFAGATVTYGAESSAPGDWLHPVKLAVNERLLAVVHGEDDPAWMVTRVARRAREATALSQRKNVRDAQWKKLEELVTKHSDVVRAKVSALKEKGEEEAAVEVETELNAAVHSVPRRPEASDAEVRVVSRLRILLGTGAVKKNDEPAAKPTRSSSSKPSAEGKSSSSRATLIETVLPVIKTTPSSSSQKQTTTSSAVTTSASSRAAVTTSAARTSAMTSVALSSNQTASEAPIVPVELPVDIPVDAPVIDVPSPVPSLLQ